MGSTWRIIRMTMALVGVQCSILGTQSCTTRDNNQSGEFADRSQRKTIKANKKTLRMGRLDAEEEAKIEQAYLKLPALSESSWPPHSAACVDQLSASGADAKGFPQLFAQLSYHSRELGPFASASQASVEAMQQIQSSLEELQSKRLSAVGEILVGELQNVPDAWKKVQEFNCAISDSKAELRGRACAFKAVQAKMETHSQYQYLALSAVLPPEALAPNYAEAGGVARLARRTGNAEVRALRSLAGALKQKEVVESSFATAVTAALAATRAKIAFLNTAAAEISVQFNAAGLEKELNTLQQAVASRSAPSGAQPGVDSEGLAEQIRAFARQLKAEVKATFSRRESRDSARSAVVDLEELLSVCLGESDSETE